MNTGRLSTHRGPYGDVIVTKTYTNWRYSVTLQMPDGAIEVKHGDWLTKYSAAMYNDFTRIHEFGRMDKSGSVEKILNVNHIFAGEIVYHIPTYSHAHPLMGEEIEVKGCPLTDEQKQKIIVDTLKEEYDLKGERLEILVEAAHYVHRAEKGVEVGEIIGETAGWIVEETALGTVVGAVSTSLQLVSAALTPIMIGIIVLNANDTDRRLAGMQAIGYAITAWAFDDPIPPYPSSLRVNNAVFPGKQILPRLEMAWNDACDATVRNLEAKVEKRGRSKESYQHFWRGIGKGERKELVRLLMDARAEELDGVERMSFQALDPDGYPH
jgi:hypothetical protein